MELLAGFGAHSEGSCECEMLLLHNCWMNGSGSWAFCVWEAVLNDDGSFTRELLD